MFLNTEPMQENDSDELQLGNNNKKENQVNIQSMISLTKLEWQVGFHFSQYFM